MAMPRSMEEIGERMQTLQERTEMALRPLLAKQFRDMAVCMESGGRSESIQNCLKSAQNNVVKVQNQLDQVVSTFGQSMQTGMQKCQADAQQLMASGGVEKDAERMYMDCANNVAVQQLGTFDAMNNQIDSVLRSATEY